MYSLFFKNLKIDRYDIGTLIGQATYQNEQIQSQKIQIQNAAGKIDLKNISFKIKANTKTIITTNTIETQHSKIDVSELIANSLK